MANDATALARWYKGSSLTLDSMASGMVRTHSADAPIADSAPAGEGLEAKLDADRSNIKEVLSTYFGITDLTDEEVKTIKDAKEGSVNYAVGPIISKGANIGWTTGGHTGGDVVLYTYTPNGDRPSGVIDNTDVNKYMTRVLGLEQQAVDLIQ
ncbi:MULTISPECIES: alkaline phosphatase [unclassified Paenibacillus]|uniref:alkaline phosphatase n=1 Tax=unclassified Paenibacillus TaxID=185978 RepID=UPI0024B95889|nr:MULTISPECIES: alkaline phosphatase [unclassified Paenibacillus]